MRILDRVEGYFTCEVPCDSRMLFKLFVAVVLIIGLSLVAAWRDGSDGASWDYDCDFYNTDLQHVRSSGEACGGICARTEDCDHFTWTNYEGGTCWMKYAYNPIADKVLSNPGAVCGIIFGKVTWTHPVG